MKVKRICTVKTDDFVIGDIISFKLTSGEAVEAMAVGRESGTTAFILVDCLKTEYAMNDTPTTEGGYEASELRKILNTEILDSFPEKIKRRMVPFENGDFLMLPTKADILGSETEKCWEPMKFRRNRIACKGKNGDPEWYWLRDVVSSAIFANVTSAGFVLTNSAPCAYGVRPHFLLS